MDIDALVDYFEKRGFKVYVMPNILNINRGELWYAWGIYHAELKYAYPETLIFEADRIIHRFTTLTNGNDRATFGT